MINHHLAGEYECKLDVKGRLRLPSALVRQLSPGGSINFTINRGLGSHKFLTLWPQQEWAKEAEVVSKLSYYNQQERLFQQHFFRGATLISTDSIDRVNLPNTLKEWAGLGKEVILFALANRIEIYDKETYDQVFEEDPAFMSDLADKVLGQKKQADESHQHEVS